LEPTAKDVAEALKKELGEDVFSQEDYEEMCGKDVGDAIGEAFTILIEQGIDPDEFLKEKGITE